MDKENVITLLNQIIKKAEEEDKEHKIRMFSEHTCQKAEGTSWMVFHLNQLKKLIEKV